MDRQSGDPSTAHGTGHDPVTVERGPEPTETARAQARGTVTRSLILGGLAAGLLALAGAALALRLWWADIDVPFGSVGDLNLVLMLLRNMEVSGWFQSTPLLNAPLGQDLLGYPAAVGDLWSMVGLKVLTLFLTPVQTLNTAFLLTFPIVAAITYGALRLLGISSRFAIPLGAAYAWLPYHFLRGEGHIFLSNYAMVPVACVLALSLLDPALGERVWSGRRRVIAVLAAAVVLGGTGLYYAAFALVLLAAAGTLGSIAQRSWRPLARGAMLGALATTVLVLSAAPNLLYQLQGGVTAVAGRSYGAAEFYGLKITNLLLPLGSHRIAALGALRDRTADSAIPGEGSETLGLLGAAGLIVIVLALLVPVPSRLNGRLLQRLRPLGALATISLLVATVAGVNGLMAVAGFSQLRAWNRMSVVIAFFALAGTALVLDAGWHRLNLAARWPRPWPTLAAVAAAGLVAMVGLADQTSNAFVPDYPRAAAVWQSDAHFFADAQDALGADAQVFQLPIVPFPENPPVVEMNDYDHLAGYQHSDLAWSYGGLKGGAAEWQALLVQTGLSEALPGLVSTGFDAIIVNRLGYEDRGEAVEAEILAVIGPQSPILDDDSSRAIYDLSSYAARLEESGAELPDADELLFPVRLDRGEGFYDLEAANDTTWNWLGAAAEARLVNPAGEERKVSLRATVTAESPNATVVVRIGQEETVLHLVGGSADLEILVTAAPGVTPVTITTDAIATPTTPDDLRDLRLRLVDLVLEPLP